MERLAVFDDTPLATHFQDVGMEDWGIDEAPIEVPAAKQPSVKPLLLSESSQHMREARLRALVRDALSAHISKKEVGEFLDQFKYQIISSNLLERRPLYAHWSTPTCDRRLKMLASAKGPWDMIAVAPKYWANGGPCIVLIVSLLAWKHSRGPCAKLSLVATALACLFIYSHGKRRLLRLLHRKCLAQSSLFAHNSKILDGDFIRCLRLIQQSDLISGGTGAKKLKAVLTSAIGLLEHQYIDGIKDCFGLYCEEDLQRYWEIYDMHTMQIQLGFVLSADFVGFKRPIAGTSVLNTLKTQFQRVHFLRRVFMCCVLTISASEECSIDEFEKWTVVYDQLVQMADLAVQLSTLMTKDRFEPSGEPRAETTSIQDASGDKSVLNMSLLSQHIAARMDLLTNSPLDPEEYAATTTQISNDLASLNQMWQRQATVSSSTPNISLDHTRRDSLTSHASLVSHSSLVSQAPSTPDTLVGNDSFDSFSRKDLTVDEPFERDAFMLELASVLQKRPAH